MAAVESSLDNFITHLNIIDSEREIDLKLMVVNRFEVFMERTIKSILYDMEINFKVPRNCLICKVCTHGSTELRTSLKNSDIDVVLVLANHLSRNQWFNLIVAKLEQNHEIIRDIVPVIETFVPVIKLKFEGIQFDLVISCLTRSNVPIKIDFQVDFNKVPKLYEGVDGKSIRGLSSMHILQMIKSQLGRHQLIFTKFIQAIKIWTLKREIDSYIFGYPSAIAWVLMSFFVYQKLLQTSIKISVVQLLKAFFSIFKVWNWPTPVVINQVISSSENIYIDASKYDNQLMPVISLVYPFKNTAFTVRKSSLAVIKEEFKRANTLIHSNIDFALKWKRLFINIDLSQEYKHFVHLQLTCASDSFIRFKGLIASKLRDYASQLENISHILLARIHSIERKEGTPIDIDRKQNHSWVIGLKLEENLIFKRSGKRTQVDISEATQCFFHILTEKSPYNNFQKMLNVRYVKGFDVLNIIES